MEPPHTRTSREIEDLYNQIGLHKYNLVRPEARTQGKGVKRYTREPKRERESGDSSWVKAGEGKMVGMYGAEWGLWY